MFFLSFSLLTLENVSAASPRKRTPHGRVDELIGRVQNLCWTFSQFDLFGFFNIYSYISIVPYLHSPISPTCYFVGAPQRRNSIKVLLFPLGHLVITVRD